MKLTRSFRWGERGETQVIMVPPGKAFTMYFFSNRDQAQPGWDVDRLRTVCLFASFIHSMQSDRRETVYSFFPLASAYHGLSAHHHWSSTHSFSLCRFLILNNAIVKNMLGTVYAIYLRQITPIVLKTFCHQGYQTDKEWRDLYWFKRIKSENPSLI